MASALDTKELDKLMRMNVEQLETEAGLTNTIKAQLKQHERQFLAERETLKTELDNAPPGEEGRVRDAIKVNDDNIIDNEKELLALETKRTLIGALKKGFTGHIPSLPPSRTSSIVGGKEYEEPGGEEGELISRILRREDHRLPTKIMGRMPEYTLKEDFELFLLKFRTYTSLNKITDNNQSKLLLDTCLSDQAKQRCGYITALDEPYLSQTFKEYTDCLKLRFHPKAKSLLFKSTYDNIKQRSDQNIQDYLALKFSAFLRGYPSWPFEHFVRTMTEKLYSEDLKIEIIRHLGNLESCKETEILDQQKRFSEIMQIANTALDLCRRTSSLSPEQMNKNGLGIESAGGESSTSSPTTAPPTMVSQAREEPLYETADWYEEEGEGDLCWEADLDPEEEHPLTQQETDYCYKLESEQESNLWEREHTVDELAQINQSPTKKLCFNCSSQNHLVAQCPTRLQIVQQRTQRIFTQSGRQSGRGQRGFRGPSRGGRRQPGGSRTRPGYAGSRSGPPGRPWSGNAQSFAPAVRNWGPTTNQARFTHTNPYNTSQAPATVGPNPQTFFRS